MLVYCFTVAFLHDYCYFGRLKDWMSHPILNCCQAEMLVVWVKLNVVSLHKHRKITGQCAGNLTSK